MIAFAPAWMVSRIVSSFGPPVARIGMFGNCARMRRTICGVAAAPESLLLQPLREIVTRESYARHGGVIPAVVRAQMGNDAGIIGAALLDRAVRE